MEIYQMEKSSIQNIDMTYLRGIQEKLYTKIHVLYHNIEHIERALCYCIWILNLKVSKEELKNDFSDKDLNKIALLIETHAKSDDIVDFKNLKFKSSEKKNIRILSNI